MIQLYCLYHIFVSSILYVKAIENETRDMETDLADCIGSLSVDKSCPSILINFNRLLKLHPDLVINMTEGNCTER